MSASITGKSAATHALQRILELDEVLFNKVASSVLLSVAIHWDLVKEASGLCCTTLSKLNKRNASLSHFSLLTLNL